VYASHFGFDGLLGREKITPLRLEDVRGILPQPGCILGCSTRADSLALPDGEPALREAVDTLRGRTRELGIDALVLIGGDGTIHIAARLGRLGMPCVAIPKTIDADVGETEQTCGIDSAVESATRAIDALHSTAEAHQRVMILECMGRHAGFLSLRAGIAGGADAVLVPEIPYDIARVVARIREREKLGLRFTIIVVGEGAHAIGGPASEVEPAHPGRLARLGGAGQRIARELEKYEVHHEVRVTVLGHLQRGAIPTAADRLLATRFGVHAAQLCARGRFGRMVSLRAGHVDSIPIAEACRRASVDPEGELVGCARAVGIELGAP
jgi:6-phosphofructokinase 1